MQPVKDKLIVALDVDTLKKAEHFVDILYPAGIKLFKVGSQLFTACGPEAVRMVAKKGARVFLDLKFHDIPHTVSSATGLATSILVSTFDTAKGSIVESVQDATQAPVFMMTVHTKGGLEMLKAALRGAIEKAAGLNIPKPLIIGVTSLTSDENNEDTQRTVLQAARMAKDVGLDGVVCAVSEAAMMRKEFGSDFVIVTPGIRIKKVAGDDQQRTATVSQALKAGSDFLVIGRPILTAKDPASVVDEILQGVPR